MNKQAEKTSMDHPELSIIIPTFNRPKQLTACIGALADQDYPVDKFEVIVVDDGGERNLESVIKPFRKKIDLQLVSQENQGPAVARNNGVWKASGRFIAFTDDDCAPDRDWLRKLSARFLENPDMAVGGKTINRLENNIYSSASQLLIDYLLQYFNPKYGLPRFFPSSNLAFPRERFLYIGGFNSLFRRGGGEDREICARWLHHGYGIIHAPECRVFHSHEMNLSGFLRQHFNYGRGAFHFHQISCLRHGGKPRFEPPSFYFKMLLYPYHRFAVRSGSKFAFLLLLAQIVNVCGFFGEIRIEKKSKAG